jgi:hypothetical protein
MKATTKDAENWLRDEKANEPKRTAGPDYSTWEPWGGGWDAPDELVIERTTNVESNGSGEYLHLLSEETRQRLFQRREK